MKELTIEKGIIQNKEIPLKSYNYSFIKDHLKKKYRQKVSLTTVIRRAKKHGFYLKKPKRTTRDREVLTRYVGELIQHDSSYHLWAPAAKRKPPGLISWPSKPSCFDTDSLIATM